MKWRKGPRPWPIHAFALALFAVATMNLMAALANPKAQQDFLLSLGFDFARYKDLTIVACSAWFTIELIPIALVWLAASRFARGLITVMAVVKAALMLSSLILPGALPGPAPGQVLALAAVALLYTRGANEWFGREGFDPAVFE